MANSFISKEEWQAEFGKALAIEYMRWVHGPCSECGEDCDHRFMTSLETGMCNACFEKKHPDLHKKAMSITVKI